MKEFSEGHGDSLALFQRPSIDTSIERHMITDYRHDGVLSSETPIGFTIAPNSPYYIDLRRTRLKLIVQITKADGTPIAQADQVGMVNLGMHSLIQQAEVLLNQTNVTPDVGRNYPYKAMFDTLLNFGEDEKETFLQSEMFYKDTAGEMNSSDPSLGANGGLSHRYRLTMNGRLCDLEGPLCLDLARQNRFIPNGVGITVKLYPTPDSFRLMAKTNEKYKVQIRDAILRVHELKLIDSVMIGHSEAFQAGTAFFPHTRSVIKTYNIPTGSYDFSVENMFQSKVPSRVTVGLVAAAGYNGDYKKNPYNFEHFNLNRIDFQVDNTSRPGRPLNVNFANGNYCSAYQTLFSIFQKYHGHESDFISRSDYGNGYAIYVFQISSAQRKSFMQLPRNGLTSLNMSFSVGLRHPVTVVVYGEFPGFMEIDRTRNIILSS